MDASGAENAIPLIPLQRKKPLLAGSDDGKKTRDRIASLIATCRLNGINPEAYITAALRNIHGQHVPSDVAALMPWSFREESSREAKGDYEQLHCLLVCANQSTVPKMRDPLFGIRVPSYSLYHASGGRPWGSIPHGAAAFRTKGQSPLSSGRD